ncbi:MAG: hypothetical protein HZC42_00595 [Candidatus Eisenbacteria bacterium]|nr:hypothetical protein [Candidatus Eisenbacteria bacterium]
MQRVASTDPPPAAPSDRWARIAGCIGAAFLLIGLALLAHTSRADRRQVLGRYSVDYFGLVAFLVASGAWWAGGLRRGSAWARAAGRSLRVAVEAAGLALFTFALIEGACRLVERPLSRYIGGPALARRYQDMVHLNSRRMRGPEWSLARPPGTWRLLALGDSFTFGLGVPQESTCVRHLERDLARPGGPRVEVINTGWTGYNTVEERAVLDTLGLRFQPDLVLLGYCLNDPERRNTTFPLVVPEPIALRLGWSVAYHSVRALAYHVMVALKLRPGYTDYIHSLYDTGTPEWRRHVQALRGIVADARAAGAPVVVAVWPLPDHAHGFSPYEFAREHEQAVRAVEASGALVVDLLPLFAHGRYTDFALSDWDPHPNPGAQRRAAAAIRDVIEARGLGPGGAR